MNHTDETFQAGPLRFHPFLRPLVWGGRRLAEVLNKPLPNGSPYGESWEVSDHPLHRSVVAVGPHMGRSLRSLMEHHRRALLGEARHETFPWLVKFLDAQDWLSVQVHPDEEAVRRLWPGEGPKTEAWFVIEARPGSRIYAGLLPGVGKEDLRRAIAAGAVAECLHHFEPRAGDCLFLPAGTVHAVGGGVLLAEVQQTSDATFRLYDWGRLDALGQARPLHVEEGLASIHWDQGPVHPVHPLATQGGAQPLVRCPYFHLDYRAGSEPFPCGGTGTLQALIVVGGRGAMELAGWDEQLTAGQAWVFPAAGPPACVRPGVGLTCLICTLPI
ncbi:MAG: class I mannose-6-phosphate isomerase [Gemmataceae bacterium]|nr:class I mannose-6-phosphate isomerase [Gemmataceae bacterium]